MKIALIADLHGNKPATEALERDLQIQKPDLIYCLGDIVGKGPSSDFTFDWALRHSDLILAGNWDIGVGKKLFAQNDHPYFDQLGEERMNKLLTFPIEHEIMMSGRRIRLFHGRPLMKELIMIHHERDLIAPFFFDNQGDAYDVVAYADAHRQGVRTVSMQSMHPQDANSMDRYGQGSHSGIFLNTGSVGNAMGVAKCCYAIIEGEMGEGVGAKDGSQNQKGDSPDISKEKSKAPNEKGDSPDSSKEKSEAPNQKGDSPDSSKEKSKALNEKGDSPDISKEKSKALNEKGDSPDISKEKSKAPNEKGEAPNQKGDSPNSPLAPKNKECEAPNQECEAPFEIRLRQLDYDKAQAIRDAENMPQIPRIASYINEIKTGIYSR